MTEIQRKTIRALIIIIVSFLFIKLIKRIGPINASFVTYLVPVSSIFLGIVVLDEILTTSMIIGTALIFLGVFFANKQKAANK